MRCGRRGGVREDGAAGVGGRGLEDPVVEARVALGGEGRVPRPDALDGAALAEEEEAKAYAALTAASRVGASSS